jgi:hypothetical protein
MVKHVLLHNEDGGPMKCDKCGYSCGTRSEALKVHKGTTKAHKHEWKHVYECSFNGCTIATPRPDVLKKHMLRQHGIDAHGTDEDTNQ